MSLSSIRATAEERYPAEFASLYAKVEQKVSDPNAWVTPSSTAKVPDEAAIKTYLKVGYLKYPSGRTELLLAFWSKQKSIRYCLLKWPDDYTTIPGGSTLCSKDMVYNDPWADVRNEHMHHKTVWLHLQAVSQVCFLAKGLIAEATRVSFLDAACKMYHRANPGLKDDDNKSMLSSPTAALTRPGPSPALASVSSSAFTFSAPQHTSRMSAEEKDAQLEALKKEVNELKALKKEVNELKAVNEEQKQRIGGVEKERDELKAVNEEQKQRMDGVAKERNELRREMEEWKGKFQKARGMALNLAWDIDRFRDTFESEDWERKFQKAREMAQEMAACLAMLPGHVRE